jgi:hypothetical protein
MVQDKSRKQRPSCSLLLVLRYLVSCPELEHMLAYDHFSNEQFDMLYCNKQPVDIESMFEA